MAYFIFGTLHIFVGTLVFSVLFFVSYQTKHRKLPWFFIGTLYNIFSLSFFYTFLPGPWSTSIFLQYLIVTLFILLGSLTSGISFLIIPYALSFFEKKKFQSLFLPLYIVPVFILSDMLRSFLLSLLYLGEQSAPGLRLFLGSLGEPLAFTPLIVFAYHGGVYFLTGIFAFIIFIIFAYCKKMISLGVSLFYLAVLFVCYTLLAIRPITPLKSVSIDIVSTAFKDPKISTAKEDFVTRMSIINELLQTKTKQTDLLILPESSYYLEISDLFETIIPKNFVSILDSQTIIRQGVRENVSLLYTTRDETREVRSKNDLMVFSEYSSYLANFIISRLSSNTSYQKYLSEINTKQSHSFHTFMLPTQKKEKSLSFAALLCSEATSYSTIYSFEKEKPDFYVLQSNLAIMKRNKYGLYQYEIYTKLLGATIGKPVISVANMAPSLLVNGKGGVVKQIDIGNNISSINTTLIQ